MELFECLQGLSVFLAEMKSQAVYRQHSHVVRLDFKECAGHFQYLRILFCSQQNVGFLADGPCVKRLDLQKPVVIYQCRVCLAGKSVCVCRHCEDVGDGVSRNDPPACLHAFLVSLFAVHKLCEGYLVMKVFRIHDRKHRPPCRCFFCIAGGSVTFGQLSQHLDVRGVVLKCCHKGVDSLVRLI